MVYIFNISLYYGTEVCAVKAFDIVDAKAIVRIAHRDNDFDNDDIRLVATTPSLVTPDGHEIGLLDCITLGYYQE